MSVRIECAFDEMVALSDLLVHPKNPNQHTKDQITRLAQIIAYQGFRNPVKVSKLSGYVTAGHGRIEAARKLGMATVPVDFQEYDDEAQEYADLVADNAIAEWSFLDLAGINESIVDFGPELDVTNLGLKSFTVSPEDGDEILEPKKRTEVECPNCGQHFDAKEHKA